MSNPTESGKLSLWLSGLKRWVSLKGLERDLRQSEKFQKECEKIRCFHLAELEKSYRVEIQQKIKRLELRTVPSNECARRI